MNSENPIAQPNPDLPKDSNPQTPAAPEALNQIQPAAHPVNSDPVPVVPPPVLPQPETIQGSDAPENSQKKKMSKQDMVLLILIVAMGIGPGSIVVGIYLCIRAIFGKSFKKFLKGIFLIIFGIIITSIFIAIKQSSGKTELRVINLGNDSVEISMPADLREIQKDSDYAAYGLEVSGSADRYLGQISAQVYQDAGDYDGTNASEIETLVNSQDFKDALGENIRTFCSNAKITEPEKTEVRGTALAYKVDYTCPLQKDGSEYGGTFISAFSGKDTFIVMVSAEKDTWMSDSKVWDGAVSSIKINAH